MRLCVCESFFVCFVFLPEREQFLSSVRYKSDYILFSYRHTVLHISLKELRTKTEWRLKAQSRVSFKPNSCVLERSVQKIGPNRVSERRELTTDKRRHALHKVHSNNRPAPWNLLRYNNNEYLYSTISRTSNDNCRVEVRVTLYLFVSVTSTEFCYAHLDCWFHASALGLSLSEWSL